jgi:hypothetical protein
VTTLVSLAARDFIVVGCDSLATTSVPMVSPFGIDSNFFDPNTGEIKVDSGGKPLLKSVNQIWEMSISRPVDQLPSVTKIFDLKPKKAGLLFAGTSKIGETTIKNLVESFKHLKETRKYKSYTIEGLAQRFADYVESVFAKEIPTEMNRPRMDVILSGFSAGHRSPETWKITFSYNWSQQKFEKDIASEKKRGSYGFAFGGQYDVIERIIYGLDLQSWDSLRERCWSMLEEYQKEVDAALSLAQASVVIPKIDRNDNKYSLFGTNFGGVKGVFFSDVGSLSEQAGIDLVHFLISTMIKSQEFSSSIPTVGGNIHLAIITAEEGFKWISKEEYRLETHTVPKFTHVGNLKTE